MTLLMINEQLRGSGYQLRQCKTKVRVENEAGRFLNYKSSLHKALKALDRIGVCDAAKMIALAAKPDVIKLTDELRKELVAEAKKTWNYIAYDWLLMFIDHSCSAEDAREGTGDRIEDRRFFQLSDEDQEAILAEAIPHAQCI